MTWYYDSSLANSRGLVAGNNVTISNAVDGQCTISAQVTGSGATSSGSYLTMVTEASLPQSRVATEGNGITITDAGAGGAGTIGVASTITGANVLTWDAGDTIFTNRRQMLFGSGLLSQYGTNSLTLTATSLTPVAGAGISLTTTATSTTISVNGVTSTTSTPYAPTPTDFVILVNSTGGAKVVDLPAEASNLGRILHIKKFDTSGNTVTVNRNTGLIDGSTSYVLSASYQGVSLACDGTNWAVF